jgi:hypothetical protein
MEPRYDLRAAAAQFFPGGRITRDKLKHQIRLGRLQAELVCGQYMVTESALLAMCQGQRNVLPATDLSEPQPAGGQHG